jgi:hypothetical protein
MLTGLLTKFKAELKILGIGFGVGPFLSLPHFILNATQLQSSQVGADCESTGETVQQFKDSYTNLTRVEYDVGIGGGIDIDLGFFGNWPITIASTEIPLATQCLVYKTDGPTLGLAEATAVLAEITSPLQPTGTGADQTKEAASSLFSYSLLLSTCIPLCVIFSNY